MFSHLITCKALFSLTNCHQKHQMPQHTKCNIITQWLITTRGEIPTLILPTVPLFLKSTKKGETTCNFKNFLAHFQSQIYLYLHNTCVLTPWWDAAALFFVSDLSWEVGETPPPPQEREEVSPLPLQMIQCAPLLHHCKSKKPSVNTQLILDTFEIQMQSTYHTFLATNLLIGIGFPVLQ